MAERDLSAVTAPAVRWHVSADATALAAAVSARILAAADDAIRARGAFHLVLAGGATPRPLYARLAAAGAEWARWRLYFGDERCLPRGAAGRNDSMAHAAWLGHAAMAAAQVHTIPAELGADAAARRYAALLAGVGDFDLVLLGLGADGHTASLFPGHALGDEAGASDVLAVHTAPTPPAARVTLSAARLGRARQVFFVVVGADKRAAVQAWRRGAAIPASRIRPPGGVDVFVDAAALPPG